MKSQTGVLSVMYLSAVGFKLVVAGIAIRGFEDALEVDDDIEEFTNLFFAGGFITTLFWVKIIREKLKGHSL